MTGAAGPSPLAHLAFVLVSPRSDGNVGACARALKNCGVTDFRLVDPPPLGVDARKMAWKSLEMLRRAKRFDVLADAVADCRLVAGFTARPRGDDREVLTLDDAVPRLLAARAQGKAALLFGREDRGLTAAELAPCSFLVRIPAARERQVFNLSQAVLLAAHRLRSVAVAETTPLPGCAARRRRPLPRADLDDLRARIHRMLLLLGYDRHADEGLARRIEERAARLLDRAQIDESDRAMVMGVLRRIEGKLAGGAGRPTGDDEG